MNSLFQRIQRFRRRAGRLACAIALVGCAVGAPFAAAGDKAELVTLNFANADIVAVIQAVSKISGRNFVIDPRVKGSINIVTATPVDAKLTYPILLSALRLQGYAAIEGQEFTKIVPEAEAKLHAVSVGRGEGRSRGDRLVSEVITLRHESAAQMLPVVRPLVSPNNTVAAYPGNNTLVITDYAENVRRIAQIVAAIDVPQHEATVIRLQHAAALELAASINRLMNEGSAAATGDASQRITVIGEARSNSLLVRSDNPSRINAVRHLVATLDQPGAADNIHVIYLKNADATHVAQTLHAVLSGTPVASTSPGAGSFAPTPPPGTTTGMTQAGSTAQSSFAGAGGTLSGSLAGAASPLTPASGGIVQADPHSNALIITAPEAIYNNLRRVVDQLDRRRAQVYVEALITEITTEKAAEIGIQWLGGRVGSTTVIGGTNFGTSGNNLLNLAAVLASGSVPSDIAGKLPGTGLNVLLGGGSISVGGREIPSLNVLARFLETDSRANILSTPNLVMLDNEEAKIVVGRNLPFVTGQYTTTAGGSSGAVGNPFQTIERKDVGLTLKVKPQISEGGTVRLQIYQEASSVIDDTIARPNGPTTSKRSIESTVLVDDGAVIALGGLVEDNFSGGEQKVPLLGDIPLIGQLFRYDSRKRGKTNLIVFLRPVILRDAASSEGISAERYNYVIGQQRAVNRPLPGAEPPAELPPLVPGQRPATPADPAADSGERGAVIPAAAVELGAGPR